jgi:hypothetical protein
VWGKARKKYEVFSRKFGEVKDLNYIALFTNLDDSES